jgi:hypothetical protein
LVISVLSIRRIWTVWLLYKLLGTTAGRYVVKLFLNAVTEAQRRSTRSTGCKSYFKIVAGYDFKKMFSME